MKLVYNKFDVKNMNQKLKFFNIVNHEWRENFDLHVNIAESFGTIQDTCYSKKFVGNTLMLLIDIDQYP